MPVSSSFPAAYNSSLPYTATSHPDGVVWQGEIVIVKAGETADVGEGPGNSDKWERRAMPRMSQFLSTADLPDPTTVATGTLVYIPGDPQVADRGIYVAEGPLNGDSAVSWRQQ